MVPIWYASLGEVKRAADIASSALYDARLSDVLTEATDAVRSLCNRSFEPVIQTVVYQWPQDMTQDSRMLWLGQHQFISISEVIDGDGQILNLANLKLFVFGSEDGGQPPYNALWNENGWTANSRFPNRSLTVTGTVGYQVSETVVATTVTTLSGTTVDVSDGSQIAQGSLIRIGNERLVVRDKGWINSGNSAAITLDAEEFSDRFTVTSGGAFHVGESITIESEEMRITKITGNQLIVQRATNGSAISAHVAVTLLYVDRRLTVERSVLGSTAVNTISGADVLVFGFPGLVRQLCRAEALNIINQDAAAYGSRSGSGQGEIPLTERALELLRKRVLSAHGYRPARAGAI
jgi:hypothetical protein